MVWPFSSANAQKDADSAQRKPVTWVESVNDHNQFQAAKEWAPVVLFSLASLGALQLYANFLRRIPGAGYVRPDYFHKRSIYGRVTSVGDGDNFHLFHTPGGRTVGWGWLRKVPEGRKDLKDRTVSV